ncbi:molybdopterin-binding protein [Nitrososphaera sp. AFS]|uniref:molybdopterin-binding protein n=1 Tax=Nitrososphaera sp. AFS TaxID=2301191 RepID=UPI0013922AF1|nr:molybdopterin-binding protein [Nitrososphaera sp. AFS]NAL77139.1 competence damage-inducible protein A [Nitrososphaera sp. AFS]
MNSLSTEILCVGYELLSGSVLNSNAHWISQKIFEIGGIVKRITVIGDDVNEIDQAVKEAIARKPDLLIISGGLGPTYDDKTLQGVAMSLDLDLALNEYAVCMLKRSYALSKNSKVNEIRLKMAKIPVGSKPLQNPVGSAPAVLIENAGTTIICLPGVPQEMKAIFLESIVPLIVKQVGNFYIIESNYEVLGVSEAMLAPKISEIIKSNCAGALYLKTHPLGHVIVNNKNQTRLRIQIVSKGDNKAEAQRVVDYVHARITAEISNLNGITSETSIRKFHS